MAFTATVTGSQVEGNMRSVYGTFTSATGDSSFSLAPATHNLNSIVDYFVSLDTGGVGTPNPKVTISGGTLTAVWPDTLGYSGKFYVKGK